MIGQGFAIVLDAGVNGVLRTGLTVGLGEGGFGVRMGKNTQ